MIYALKRRLLCIDEAGIRVAAIILGMIVGLRRQSGLHIIVFGLCVALLLLLLLAARVIEYMSA